MKSSHEHNKGYRDYRHGGSWEEDVGQPWYIDVHDLVLEPPAGAHQFTIVLLHSCSGGPDDFLAFFHRLDIPFRGSVRAVVPCSPTRVENHYGWSGRQNSWFTYDNQSEDGNALLYPEELIKQRERLLKLLENERQKLPDGDSRRLLLWGLSQGAGLAVDVALHAPFSVGGVVALRGMGLRETLSSAPSARKDGVAVPIEVLAINGERDWMCPPDIARPSYEIFQRLGARLEYHGEPTLAHACARGRQKLNGPEMRKVSEFVERVWSGLVL